MRIGYDAKRFFHNRTGLGNYSRDLIRVLSTYYPENEYILFNPKKTPAYKDYISNGIIEKNPQGFPWRQLPALWRSFGILRDIDHEDIDIYHGLSGELPLGIGKKKVKSIVTIHDLIFFRYPEWYKPADRFFYKQKFFRSIREADLIVAISEQTKKDIIRFGKISGDNIRVIYQGCHPAFKQTFSNEDIEKIRKKYRLPGEFLLYVGTIEPRKNALTAVKALKDLPYHLVLVGRKTPYVKKIENFIETHGMQDRILFLSGVPMDELAAIYRAARLLIYPSIFEGFGIPVVEALFSGIPVVTNKHGVFPEVAGEAGFYSDDVFDAEEMKERILSALETDKDEYRKKTAPLLEKFKDKHIAETWMKTYRELIEE